MLELQRKYLRDDMSYIDLLRDKAVINYAYCTTQETTFMAFSILRRYRSHRRTLALYNVEFRNEPNTNLLIVVDYGEFEHEEYLEDIKKEENE